MIDILQGIMLIVLALGNALTAYNVHVLSQKEKNRK